MSSLSLSGIRPKVLEPVYLELAPGELVFISGPSGSGKSLLLRAIADLDPHEGEAFIDGIARSTVSAPEWRRRVGFLPAESHWWADRVGDHFPRPDPPATVDPSARSPDVDPLHLLQELGFGPEVLDWSVSRLSTGERQRLALARLLAHEPEILLLDEATANLDPANRKKVEAMIEEYRTKHNAAVLWVSHDPQQRRRLDGRRLIVRNQGLEPEP